MRQMQTSTIKMKKLISHQVFFIVITEAIILGKLFGLKMQEGRRLEIGIIQEMAIKMNSQFLEKRPTLLMINGVFLATCRDDL